MERRVQQRSSPNLIDGNLLAQLGCDQISRPLERGGRVRSQAGRRVQAKVYEGARAPSAGRPGARSGPQGGSRGPQQRRRPCTEAHSCPKETKIIEEKKQEAPQVEPSQQAPLDPVLLTCVDSFVSELIGDAVAEDDDNVLHEFYVDSDNEAQEAEEEEEEESEVGLEVILEASETASTVEAANPQEPSPVLSHAEAKLSFDECAIPAAEFSDYEEVYSLQGDENDDDLENDSFTYVHMAYSYARNAVSAGLEYQAELAKKEEAEDEEDDQRLAALIQEEMQQREVEQQKHVAEAPVVEKKVIEAGLAEPERPRVAFHLRPSVGAWLRPLPTLRPSPLASPAPEPEKAAAAQLAAELQEAVAPEVEQFLQEEQQQREREEADASDLVEEFLMEQAAEQKEAPALAPAPERKALKLNLDDAAWAKDSKAAEPEPMSAKRSGEPAKHSRRRTIIGGVVRETVAGKERPVSAPMAPSESEKAPAWALPMSPTSHAGNLRRQQSYCAGSATGTVRQARQLMAASQKDLSASVFRMDSDTEEPTTGAAKRQSSLAASYDALGVELHSMESDRPTSPLTSRLSRAPSSSDPKFGLAAKHGARPSPKGEKRSSALSRAATSIMLDGETSRRSSVQSGTPDHSPPSSRSARRSRVQLWAAPSAMEMDLSDGAARAPTAAPSREQLASVSSLGPLFKSKNSSGLLPSISASKLGASDWSVGGKRWVGANANAAF